MMQVGQANSAVVLARRRWAVVGQIQGVGFRPFVYRLAHELRLTGFVGNSTAGVFIEAQGTADQLDDFDRRLCQEKPALATIQRVTSTNIPLRFPEADFEIAASSSDRQPAAEVTVDTAVCRECVQEMLTPSDRRHGYGLINCTNCGPRFTIVRRIPYDRPHTTMASFEMCPRCRAEYTDPLDRRFHAQPVACPQCGPRVTLVDPTGQAIVGDPIREAVERLMAGQVLAIKGLGGFHLAVRADLPEAVARLRRLKVRDNKPFALMCRNLDEIRKLVELSDAAVVALNAPACPIVLALRRGSTVVAEGVAPGHRRLGVMLPYTPIQHLLFAGTSATLGPLVMTSGNVSDEPLVTENEEAIQRLGGMCDAILWHDRPIQRPVDDSVLLDIPVAGLDRTESGLLPIRRARGYVPATIPLPVPSRAPGLCVGGELKNTVAVVRGGGAILSQHLGDLTHVKAFASFEQTIADLCELFGVRPDWIAHDLHPVYLSTVKARRMSQELGVPLVGVQHHHAHAAAVMAEHGISERVLAVVCDGVGYGEDGSVWGGELLEADLVGFTRLASLSPLPLAGGDAAARDTRRCGLALLRQAFGEAFAEHPAAARLIADAEERRFLTEMIRRNVRCVPSSGAGRVFDGVAALLGVCPRNTYEAEAGMRLESLAADVPMAWGDEPLFEIVRGNPDRIDLGPLIRWMVEQSAALPVADLAARFHDQFARAWQAVVVAAAERTGLRTVALSGGVFCNERLTTGLTRLLEARGLRVLRHRQVPPNDGGLAYGQAAVAAARMQGDGA